MTCQRLVSMVGVVVWLTWMPQPCAAEESAVDLALAIVDAVIDRHFDPPAREQMILDGIRGLYKRIERPLPAGLSRRVSQLDQEDERAFLQAVWQEARQSKPTEENLESALFAGLLAHVHGNPHFSGPKESKVHEQLQGNRYVGIGVALASGRDGHGPVLHPFPQGVAYQSGIRADDEILEVDDVSLEGKNLSEAVDLLRGPEGSTVRLLIQRQGEAKPLTFSLRRSVVHFETVRGYRKQEGVWDFRVDGAEQIAYVQIPEIRGSTLHELRQSEQKLKSQSIRGLILDLRSNRGGNFHDALLLADGLLPEAAIGGAHGPERESQFQSGPECLFRDSPLAVLIDSTTTGEAEWLAAALQSGRKAVLVGMPTAGEGYSIEPVELRSGLGFIRLWTKVLYTADGRSLLHNNSEFHKRTLPAYAAAVRVDPRIRDTRLDNLGVLPDVRVGVPQGSLTKWMASRGTNALAGQTAAPEPPADMQFERALRTLNK